jgi:hypothetical protein
MHPEIRKILVIRGQIPTNHSCNFGVRVESKMDEQEETEEAEEGENE